MNFKERLKATRREGITGAVLTVMAGLLWGLVPGCQSLVNLSYDLPSRIHSSATASNVLILEIDEETYQNYFRVTPPDRSPHARLLDMLRRDEARLVVFDIFFDVPGTEAGDRELAAAMKAFGPVALACKPEIRQTDAGPSIGYSVPRPLLATNAAAIGIGGVPQEMLVVRKHHPGTEEYPSLSWAAAELAGARVTKETPWDRRAERWLNYYGDFGTIPLMPFTNAWLQPAGYFSNKFVFVGGGATPGMPGDVSDRYDTPFSKWDRKSAAGVRFIALAFLNLWGEEWLSRAQGDGLLFVLLGLIAGYGFSLFRPRTCLWLALATIGVVVSAAIFLFLRQHLWFPWTVIVAVQIPCALACKVAFGVMVSSQVPQPQPVETVTVVQTQAQPADRAPSIPDHELLERVGAGAYGEVWLARNVIGDYHAVKLIYRDAFPSQKPYERAFSGIRTFMPLSRSHPGFVHVLHVGINAEQRYFFYIMEVADDLHHGRRIAPNQYRPRSLASDLRDRSVLPPAECLALVLDLSQALVHLHGRNLIHRDIKPANIIYVDGMPKLADIDLVTELRTTGPTTYIGTAGYMPEEGLGTSSGDVYSLGKVLYVASTGKKPEQCPELPTNLAEEEFPLMLKLNEIIQKACEEQVKYRYQSARELRDALQALKEKTEARPR